MAATPAPASPSAAPTYRELFAFWGPVALSGQLITLSQPVVNAAVGHAADRATALPAYLLALHFVVLTQAAVLPGINVAVALVRCRKSFAVVRRVLLAFGAAVAALGAAVALSPLGPWLFRDLMGQRDPAIVAGACDALLWLSPSGVGVAVRGAMQGAAMSSKSTGRVAAATALRLAIIFVFAAGATQTFGMRGEIAGAAAVSLGVWTEVLSLAWQTRAAAKKGRGLPETSANVPTAAAVVRFAAPLVFGHLAWTAQRPLINAFLGRLPDREAAVAAFGVLHALTLFVSAPLWAFQSTSIMFSRNRAGLRAVARFAATVSVGTAALCLAGAYWIGPTDFLTTVFDLEGRTLALAAGALFIVALDPLLHGLRSVAAGVLVAGRRTGASGLASTAKVLATLIVGGALVDGLNLNGAAFGMGLYVLGTAVDLVALGTAARLCANPPHETPA
jgi:hypothetical protein